MMLANGSGSLTEVCPRRCNAREVIELKAREERSDAR